MKYMIMLKERVKSCCIAHTENKKLYKVDPYIFWKDLPASDKSVFVWINKVINNTADDNRTFREKLFAVWRTIFSSYFISFRKSPW